MRRCLPCFPKKEQYVINKNISVVRNGFHGDGLLIRKQSDYDKILDAPSSVCNVSPKQYKSVASKNILKVHRSATEISHENGENLDHSTLGSSVDNLEKPVTYNRNIHEDTKIKKSEADEIEESVSIVPRHGENKDIIHCDSGGDFTQPTILELDNIPINLENQINDMSGNHRPTIVELKLQEDVSGLINADADQRKISEVDSVIDSAITNVNLAEDIPQILRRSGLRLDIIDINKDVIKYKKSLEEIKLINGALIKNEFLKNILTDVTRKLIVDIMTPRDVQKDEIIIRQGEAGDNMYVSEMGYYQVTKDDEEVYTFDRNEVFGEVAVIYNHKRQATVKALTNGKLWKINRNDYFRVMITSAKEQESEIMTFLKTVPTIKDAPQARLKQAVGLFTLRTFTSDSNIVIEGEEGNEFFIIKAGIVKIVKKHERIAKLSRGQFFGEQALLNNYNKRQATVIAETPVVECLVLSVTYFKQLFGDMAQFMTLPYFVEPDDPVVHNKYSNIQLHSLVLRTTLGVGGFGRVELAHLIKDNKETFALKYLKRKRIVENEQIEHVFNEKIIQMQCKSAFIVQLYKTYNDRKYLYLLLELCLGGDIINLLQRQRLHCCKEEDTKFLAACVLEALNYLHDRNFVFRDLKPENMMLDQIGYVKLTDFGFAKKLEHGQRTYTFAGTPEYVAPEIIYHRGHDRAVDYWAFGIFIFEMLVGKTPFKSADPSYMDTYNLIVRGIENVIFPTKVKNNAENLIKKLCNATPSARIGYKRKGIQEIREHKWFQGFNWEKLQLCKMTSPFVPKLTNHLDTRYSDKQKPDTDIPDDDATEVLNKF